MDCESAVSLPPFDQKTQKRYMTTPALDFGFAFDDADFSDRVLRIELISESVLEELDGISSSNRKRKNSDMDHTDTKVITLNVNSLILAANSPFFYKLFKNGMKESQQREVTMRINASEGETLMDLLNFMYKNVLEATTAPDLLKVLVAADKYEVTSCITYCTNLLKETPSSLESTLLYLELPPSEAVQPLKDAAKNYLVENFRDFSRSRNKAMELPLSALEIVLGIDGLKVTAENRIFDFIVEWGRAHYPKVKERQRVLTHHLAKFINFSYILPRQLEKVLACPDFFRKPMTKLVLESLHFNSGFPYGKDFFIKDHTIKRVYSCNLIKVASFESPLPRRLVYFNLTKDEARSVNDTKRLLSQAFYLDGRQLGLSLSWNMGQYYIGLGQYKGKGSETCAFDFELTAMIKSSKVETVHNVVTFGSEMQWSRFPIPWNNFPADIYFINGILHLQAEITIRNTQA